MPQTNEAQKGVQQKDTIFRGVTAEQMYGAEVAARIKNLCQTKPKETVVALKSDFQEMRAQQSSHPRTNLG